jgi:hypothetical protein
LFNFSIVKEFRIVATGALFFSLIIIDRFTAKGLVALSGEGKKGGVRQRAFKNR